MAGRVRDVNKTEERRHYDYSLLFLTLFLVGFGLIMIYSTSAHNSFKLHSDSAYYLKKQAFFSVAGIIIMIITSKINYKLLMEKLPIIKMRPIMLLYFMCIGLQVYVIQFGKEIKGAKRWIEVGSFFSFQPSELTKLAVILVTAYIVYLAPRRLDRFMGFIRVIFFILPLLGLVFIENFSTGFVIAVIMLSICFVASRKKYYYVIASGIFGTVGYIFINFVSFRSSRMDAWRDVETHEKGYQILQGLYAIASGGVFGKGLGQSMQKLGYIPESHNDMIFAVVCEELGLFGGVSLVLLFVLLLWRIFLVAISAPDLFGSLICIGIMAHIAVQVLINIAVVTNTIPSTGIPLPFISYGGTSTIILLFEIGLVLSVSNQIKEKRNG